MGNNHPPSRTEKVYIVEEWLSRKGQEVLMERRGQHADKTGVAEGWALRKPICGAQMGFHKSYRLVTLCDQLEDSDKPMELLSKQILEQIVEGRNWQAILLTGLIEEGWVSIPELDEVIKNGGIQHENGRPAPRE